MLTSSGRLSVPMEMRELYSCSRSCLACKIEVMESSEISLDSADDAFSDQGSAVLAYINSLNTIPIL